MDGHFVESYYPTIENTFSKEIRVKGQEYATEIVDTAGQDEYSILNSKHFIGIHGYMLVYSVASLPSFEMVQVIRDKILNHLVCLSYIFPSSSPFPVLFFSLSPPRLTCDFFLPPTTRAPTRYRS